MRHNLKWEDWYQMAVVYRRQHGHLNIPSRYKTPDGHNLGYWLHNQKQVCEPNSEHGRMLSMLGMKFTRVHDEMWKEGYKRAVAFKKTFGHLEVPLNYVTYDGYKLGIWLHNQKQTCDPNSERGILLSNLGFKFEKYNIVSFEEMYEKAKAFFEENHNLEVPLNYVTDDGYKLGYWIHNRRQTCDPNSEHGRMLSKIGMRFHNINLTWNEMYEKAKAFFEENNHLEVPLNYVTDDGYKLGVWISNQKRKCDPNSEHGRMLSKIGMRFDFLSRAERASFNKREKHAVDWLKMYSYAVDFFKKNDHLRVPQSYKTEDGYNLGSWIATQRINYKNNTLSFEKIGMLESIGMVWDIQKDKFDLVILCDEYNVDVGINEKVLKSISFVVFKCKLMFLKDNMIRLVDVNGLLHEIFSMSSMNMKLKYGVSLEDLINKYGKAKNR